MHIELVYFHDNKYETYKGRLLGLMDDEQFANLYNNASTVANKVRTGRSVTLTEINETVFKNRRIVLSFLNEKSDPGLFITRPLTEIYNCNYNNKEVEGLSFLDNNENWITLEKG